MERVGELGRELRGDEVEPEEEGEREAEEGGGAEQRIDADGESEGERPGETAGGGSDAEEVEDGGNDAFLEQGRREGERSCIGL